MGTSIEWADEVWNPTTGCTPVSEGCRNCYAASFAHRGLTEAHRGLTVMRDGRAVFNGKIKLHKDRLTIPLKWRKPRRIFVDSMSDLFHERVPFEFIDKVFAVMAMCPHHAFLILTKRPERMAEYLKEHGWARAKGGPLRDRIELAMIKLRPQWSDKPETRPCEHFPLPNVWLGVSCEDQPTADARIPLLLGCSAAKRFVSLEPLLGPIDLAVAVAKRRIGDPQPDWAVCGGESGPHARPFNVQWARDIRDQCKAAGVPFYLKQLGARPVRREAVGETVWMTGKDDIAADLEWPEGTRFSTRPGEPIGRSIILRDRKGGEMSEWPEDLRVREMPEEKNR